MTVLRFLLSEIPRVISGYYGERVCPALGGHFSSNAGRRSGNGRVLHNARSNIISVKEIGTEIDVIY